MYRPARGGRLCEHFGGYKTVNGIPLPLTVAKTDPAILVIDCSKYIGGQAFEGEILIAT